MKWFIDLRMPAKLLVSFGLIMALLVAVIAMANRAISSISHSQAVARIAVEIENGLNSNRATVLTMLGEPDAGKLRDYNDELRAQSSETDRLMQRIEEESDSPELTRRIEQLAGPRVAHAQVRDRQTIPLVMAGRREEARAVSLGPQNDRFMLLREQSRALSEAAQKLASRQIAAATRILLLAGIVSFLLAVVIVWLLTRLIAKPLLEISATAERVAIGDLDRDVGMTERQDEVGILARSFARMTASLREMAQVADRIADGDLTVSVHPQSERDLLAKAFATMIQKMRSLTVEMAEGIQVLSSSAAQISTSTSQLAASATETAVGISETTTTVEEVRQTAHVSSQKARQVSESAQRAATVVESGQRSIEDMLAGMERIQQQMESIAESMVRLSDRSQAIGQIVATVEDLAGQSKLLAVNASIEAVKAGDHGKGFSVVAQEVKSLAEQSRHATAQVRTILGDIQGATHTAVLATEQGNAAVVAGVKQSEQAAQSIQALSASVVEAAQAAVQIAASSQQQLVGVDQVATAMESIKGASSQNVDSAKQLESAAMSVKLLGERLRDMASAYRV